MINCGGPELANDTGVYIAICNEIARVALYKGCTFNFYTQL